MLSKYAKYIELDDGNIAIFNNLVLDIFVVNKELKDQIFSEDIIDLNIKNELLDAKIYIKDKEEDNAILKRLKDLYESTMGIVKVLYLFLTDDCNLRCKYCFLENNPNCSKSKKYMSEDIALTSLNKFAKNLIENQESEGTIIFYGGEPTLNFDLLKKIVYESKKYNLKFNFNMITNSTILNDEMIRFIKDENIGIGISIDGPKHITDKNRKFRNSEQGAYNRIISAKRKLDKNNCNYSLSMVISDYFIDNKEEVLDWLIKNNDKPIFYNLMHHSYANKKANEFAEKETEFLIKSYEKLEKFNKPQDERIQRQINSFVNKNFEFNDCAAMGFKQLTVMPNGDLCICHADVSNSERHVGNIMTTEISEISNTKEAIFFKQRYTLNKSECLNCEALYCCGGGCPNHSGILFGNRDKVEEPFCIYAKKLMKWMIEKTFLDEGKEV